MKNYECAIDIRNQRVDELGQFQHHGEALRLAEASDYGTEPGLAFLVSPHMFLRFIGLSFLVPGVVSPSLKDGFAVPAAYGDLVAGILAILAAVALVKRASPAIAAVWLFNIWGAADLIFAFYEGVHLQIEPGALGASFFIVTAVVPARRSRISSFSASCRAWNGVNELKLPGLNCQNSGHC